MTETRPARPALRKIAPIAVAGCAALVATIAAGRRRSPARVKTVADPPDDHLAAAQMEALASAEGMPEAPDA